MPRREKNGFTLIELLVVILIFGILVAIAAVSWQAIAERGRDSTRKSDLARIKQALEQYYSENRSYPSFDSEPGIFAASWQLVDDNLLDKCVHSSDINSRLTPRQLRSIPVDPLDKTDYRAGCENLKDPQTSRYLYITSPTIETSGPNLNPNGFGLMATLERLGDDNLDRELNPFYATTTQFGAWYFLQDYPTTANYLITNSD